MLTKLQERSQQLQTEWGTRSAEAAGGGVSALSAKIEQVDREIETREAEIANLRGQLTDSQSAIEQSRQQQDDIRAGLQETRGHIASLTALQEAASDDRERAALGDWIETESLQPDGTVYASLEVDAGWETAIEQVLGEALSAQLLAEVDVRELAGIAALPSGAFVVDNKLELTDDVAGTLAAHVRGPARVRSWLQSVLVAESLDEAQRLCRNLPPGKSVVTPDGHWLGTGWHRRRSESDTATGMLARQSQLEALQSDLEGKRSEADALDKRISDLLKARVELEKQATQAQKAQQLAVNERAEFVAEQRAAATKVEQVIQRRNRLKTDIEETQRQYDQEQSNLADARKRLSESLDQMELDRAERERLQNERATLTEQLTRQREVAREASDALTRGELQNQNLDTQVTTLREGIGRMESQLRDLESRETELSGTLPQSDDPDAENKARLAELLEKRIVAEGELNSQRTRVGEIDNALRELEASRMTQEQAVQGIQSDLERLRLQETESAVRLETLAEEISKRGAVPQEIASALPEEASESEWQEKVDRAGARINRLGPINLAAIDEHAKASERKQYLDAQNDDLVAALETLQSAIRKIDKETRQRFKDTFDQINTGFAELFPRIFGGGTACLEMTGDDLLDTGVAIFARPPGKKNSTIHLLSGGEKAMTAIALVFSIFQLNPAPFCMLDEVDAPLDDANVGRYARMVREMSEKVQFVFITHNKISMEAADQLMGVTMQEPGVSRLVTVDVEEAAQLAAS